MSSVVQLDRVMTIDEVADHLRLSRSMIYKLVRENRLRPLKVGRKTLFRESSIQAFIESSEQSTAPASLVGRKA